MLLKPSWKSLFYLTLFCIWLGALPTLAMNRKFDFSAIPEEKQAEVLKKFPSLRTNSFTKSDLDQLIRYLVLEEQYETAEVYFKTEDNAEIYYLNLGKIQRLFKMSFLGHRYFSESQLKKETGLAEKSVFDSQSLTEATDRLKRLYRERGFRNTTIEIELKKLGSTDLEALFKVTEGPQLIIKNIKIQSPSKSFTDLFSPPLQRKLTSEPYTENYILEVKKEFREKFSKKGFFKAELTGPQLEVASDGKSVDLVFSVSSPEIFDIEFKGVTKFTKSTMREILDLDNFYSNNPNIGPELGTKIKIFYLKAGYARINVSGDEESTDRPFEKKVVLDVAEGPRVKIDEMKFNGALTQPESYYQNFIKDHSTELIAKGYYNRDEFQIGLNNLLVDRQNHGFLRAKILSTKVVFSGENKEFAHIQINFDEGPLTILKTIEIQGHQQVTEEKIKEVLKLKENEPLRLNQLEDSMLQLKAFYHNEGFLEMNLLNEKKSVSNTNETFELVQYNADSTEAKLFIKIYEGPKIKVSSIVIEGNSITKDSVIFHELDFKVGDVLTPEAIEESTRRLQRVGHFNSVEIKTLEERTQIADRTVIIKVSDRDPGLFTMGIGVNSENSLTLRGYTGIAYRNLGGTGRGASARLEGNYNPTDLKYLEYKVTLGYLEPYLFETRAKGRVNYTLDEYVSDFKNRVATNVKQITWSLEQDITSHVLLSYDLFSSAQVRTFKLAEVDNKTELFINSTGPTLTIDYRDHPFNTTSGTLTRLGVEYAHPDLGSSKTINYVKSFASFTYYLPVRTGWVWANSVRGGNLKNLCDVSKNANCGVPYSLKGINMGGQSSIRGFLPDEAFPNEYDLKNSSGSPVNVSDFKLTTEAVSFLFKSEIRFPISGPIGGALFYDGGAVWIKEQSFEDPYRDAVGLGLRYATPIGSVSFDVGYKLDRKAHRREEMFPVYLSIGTF